MRIFQWKLELTRDRPPDIYNEVIPNLERVIDSLSQGVIQLNAKYDELAKKLEATRRKVYRDSPGDADALDPALVPGQQELPEKAEPANFYRTGMPANF